MYVQKQHRPTETLVKAPECLNEKPVTPQEVKTHLKLQPTEWQTH